MLEQKCFCRCKDLKMKYKNIFNSICLRKVNFWEMIIISCISRINISKIHILGNTFSRIQTDFTRPRKGKFLRNNLKYLIQFLRNIYFNEHFFSGITRNVWHDFWETSRISWSSYLNKSVFTGAKTLKWNVKTYLMLFILKRSISEKW